MDINNNPSIRNVKIDLLRFICAFLVVVIHSPFPGLCGMDIEALSRIAVPIFIMITAYFYWTKKIRGGVKTLMCGW